MQVGGERLFTNKGPVMVKESNNLKKLLASWSISCDKGHLKVKNGPKP